MTNKDKLVAWNKAIYDSKSEEPCFVCLTQKQIYLLGQALRQVEWRTRWQGDTSSMDLNAIVGELEFRLADMTSCGDIRQILEIVTNIQNDVDSLQVQVDNILNETNYQFPNGATVDTSVTDVIPHETLIQPIAGYSSACATDADRDALYGGCYVLAEYMVQKISDLLEFLDATIGQQSEAYEFVIGAIPGLETLPIDELYGLVDFFVDHALEVWEATVTDDKKQALACLFYCYASSYGGCSLSLYDLVDLLSTKVPAGINLLTSSIRDIVAILTVGTPVGDDLFYQMLAFEMVIVGQGMRFLDVDGFQPYEYRFLSGTNSPDNDWSIYCVSCPSYYRIVERDFTTSPGDWEIVAGDEQSNGIAGVLGGADNQFVVVDYHSDTTFHIHRLEFVFTRANGVASGSRDYQRQSVYTNNTSETANYTGFDGFEGNGVDIHKCEISSVQTGKALRLIVSVDDNEDALIVLHSVKMWLSASDDIGYLVDDALPC